MKKHQSNKLFTCFILTLILIFFLGLLAGNLGYRVNLTKSMPIGIWKKTDAINQGSYVSVCIPYDNEVMRYAIKKKFLPDGKCAGGYAPLLKPITAVSGDTVTLAYEAVTVNGVVIPNTRTFKTRQSDNETIPSLARGTYQVKDDQFWLISNDHPQSFDSRYFGFVTSKDIESGMNPILVF